MVELEVGRKFLVSLLAGGEAVINALDELRRALEKHAEAVAELVEREDVFAVYAIAEDCSVVKMSRTGARWRVARAPLAEVLESHWPFDERDPTFVIRQAWVDCGGNTYLVEDLAALKDAYAAAARCAERCGARVDVGAKIAKIEERLVGAEVDKLKNFVRLIEDNVRYALLLDLLPGHVKAAKIGEYLAWARLLFPQADVERALREAAREYLRRATRDPSKLERAAEYVRSLFEALGLDPKEVLGS